MAAKSSILLVAVLVLAIVGPSLGASRDCVSGRKNPDDRRLHYQKIDKNAKPGDIHIEFVKYPAPEDVNQATITYFSAKNLDIHPTGGNCEVFEGGVGQTNIGIYLGSQFEGSLRYEVEIWGNP